MQRNVFCLRLKTFYNIALETVRCYSAQSKNPSVQEILSQVRQTSPRPSRADLESLGEKLFVQNRVLSPKEITDIARCFADLKYVRKEWIQVLTSQFFRDEMSTEMNIRFLTSLGTLQRLHDKQNAAKNSLFTIDYLPSFVQVQHHPFFSDQHHVLRGIVKNMDFGMVLEERTIVRLVYALGQLVPGNKDFVLEVEHLVNQHKIHRNPPLSSYVILLYSLSRFQIENPIIVGSLVRRIVESLAVNEWFPFEMISMVFYSLGKLRFMDKSLMERLISQAQESKVISRFSSWDLSSLFYGLSLLTFRENISELLLPLGKEICRSHRKSTYSEQGLSLVLYSLGCLRFENTKVLNSLLEEVLKPFRISELTYQGLCMILHGLEKLSQNQQRALQHHQQALIQLLANTIRLKKEILPSLNAQEVVSLSFGMRLARSCLKPWEVDSTLEILCKRNDNFADVFLDQLTPKELVILIKALAKLGFDSPSIWTSIIDYAVRSLESERIRDPGISTTILYRLSKEDYPKTSHISVGLTRRLLDSIAANDLDKLMDSDLVQLVQSIVAERDNGLNHLLRRVLEEITESKRLNRLTAHQSVNLLSSLAQMPATVKNERNHSDTLLKLKNNVDLKRVENSGLIVLLFYSSKKKDSDPFIEKIKKEFLSRPGIYTSLSSDYISMTIQSLSHMGISDPSMISPILQEVLRQQTLRSFSDKSLVLMLHSFMKLKYKNARLLALSCQEIIHRGSLEIMKLDLLSMLLYTLGRFQYHHKELFDRSFGRLIGGSLDGLESMGCINILDAMGRVGHREEHLVDKILEVLDQRDLVNPFNSRTMSFLLHSLGKLKCKGGKTEEYLKRVLFSNRIKTIDMPGVSGLVYALVEAEMTEVAYSEILINKIMSENLLEAAQVAHLGNLIYRLPSFDHNEAFLPFIHTLLHKIEEKVKTGELSVDNLGQFIIGIGSLTEKYKLYKDPSVSQTITTLGKKEVMEKMTVSDLIGNISATSHHPQAGFFLAQQTAKHLLDKKCISQCTDNELLVLKKSLFFFGNNLEELSVVVNKQFNDRQRLSSLKLQSF